MRMHAENISRKVNFKVPSGKNQIIEEKRAREKTTKKVATGPSPERA